LENVANTDSAAHNSLESLTSFERGIGLH
jgi:hypothetical protein